MAVVVDAGKSFNERLGHLVEPGHKAVVARLARERTEELALQLHVLGQRRADGDTATVGHTHNVDEVHRIARDGVGHDTASAGRDAAPRMSPSLRGRHRRDGRASGLAAAMCCTICPDTSDACVSGPMWPAPPTVMSRLTGSNSDRLSAMTRVGIGACSPRRISTGNSSAW